MTNKTCPFRFGPLEAIRTQPRAICLFFVFQFVFPKISVCFQPPKKARWFTNNEPNYVSTNISFCFQPPKKARCFTNNEPNYVSTKTTKKSPLLHQTQIPFA